MVFRCNIEKEGNSGRTIKPAAFHSNIETDLSGTDEQELCHKMVGRMLEKMATFQLRGSGLRLHSIIQLEIYIVRFNPMSRETYIPLPEALGNKKAIINIKNNGNKCF